jgi:hypothetical protein
MGESGINPTDWGWKAELDKLIPIQIDGEVAPGNVLKVVRCNCKSNCSSSMCSCRKHGLKCVTACGQCHGYDCSNVANVTVDNDADSSDSDNDPDQSDSDTAVQSQNDMPDFAWDVDPSFEYYEEVV